MTISAYKGFDKALQCRGYQFEVGKTYTHEGEVRACASGFHVCTDPLDIFSYYPPGTSRYARVLVSGATATHGDDSKLAVACLRVEEEISLHSLVSDAVAKILEGASKESAATSTGDCSAATSTGYRSAATNTGHKSAAEVSGTSAVAASLGLQGRARASAGSAIVLCYRNEAGALIHIRASKVGDNSIKPDTWYSLNENGDFVEER